GFELKILSKGIGDVSSKDLVFAQVEVEENHVPRLPIYMFNVDIDANAIQWTAKHSNLMSSIQPKKYSVFLDILQDLVQEIKLKIARQKNRPDPKERASQKEQSAPKSEGKREKTHRKD